MSTPSPLMNAAFSEPQRARMSPCRPSAVPMGTMAKPRSAIDAAQAADLGADDVVGGVHDRDRAGDPSKVVEHLHLGGGVVFQRMVPMQMVGRDVEQHGHVGREQLRGRELIRRHLGHVDVGFAGGHGGDARVADVADGGACHASRREADGWSKRVTVVLPLVPVTAIHVLESSDSRHASSTSLTTSSLTAAAERYRSENCGDARACDAQLEMPSTRLRQAIDRALAELDDGAAVARLARIRIGGGIRLPAEHCQLGHAAAELRHEVIDGIVGRTCPGRARGRGPSFRERAFLACKHLAGFSIAYATAIRVSAKYTAEAERGAARRR